MFAREHDVNANLVFRWRRPNLRTSEKDFLIWQNHRTPIAQIIVDETDGLWRRRVRWQTSVVFQKCQLKNHALNARAPRATEARMSSAFLCHRNGFGFWL